MNLKHSWWTSVSLVAKPGALFSRSFIADKGTVFLQVKPVHETLTAVFSLEKSLNKKNQSGHKNLGIYHPMTEMYVAHRDDAHKSHYHMSRQARSARAVWKNNTPPRQMSQKVDGSPRITLKISVSQPTRWRSRIVTFSGCSFCLPQKHRFNF